MSCLNKESCFWVHFAISKQICCHTQHLHFCSKSSQVSVDGFKVSVVRLREVSVLSIGSLITEK